MAYSSNTAKEGSCNVSVLAEAAHGDFYWIPACMGVSPGSLLSTQKSTMESYRPLHQAPPSPGPGTADMRLDDCLTFSFHWCPHPVTGPCFHPHPNLLPMLSPSRHILEQSSKSRLYMSYSNGLFFCLFLFLILPRSPDPCKGPVSLCQRMAL